VFLFMVAPCVHRMPSLCLKLTVMLVLPFWLKELLEVPLLLITML
jgi:hypothetical protein